MTVTIHKPTTVVTLTFTQEKETKGTFRYTEDGDPETHKVGTLYIKKSAFPPGQKAPTKVAVAISF